MDDLPAQELPREGLSDEASRPLEAGEGAFAASATGPTTAPSEERGSGLSRLRKSLDPRDWPSRPLRPLPSRYRTRAVTLILAIALVLGFSGAAPLPYRPMSGGSASPTAGASQGSSRTPAAGISGSAAPAGPTPPPSPVAVASQTSPTATISFSNLMLDSSADPAGTIRTFSFASDGPGLVSAEIVTASPAESSRLCLAAEGAKPECASGATPGVTQAAAGAHSHWTVTLTSANEGTPTVDLALRWPADHPSIELAGSRFQGYPNPDSLRSLNASFKTRAAGQMALTAAWPPALVETTLTLTDVTSSNAVTVDKADYPAAGSISGTYSHRVAAGRIYAIALFDAGPDTGRPSLSATIAFP